ncbi:MAG: hypothetical protein O7D95_02945 [Betaproteobacteria bacterium]|nr:hypothetical protein [Betaproteobacteria bacterium]
MSYLIGWLRREAKDCADLGGMKHYSNRIKEAADRLERYEFALKRIVSNEAVTAHPSDDADHAELGRYILPDRIKLLRKIANEALEAEQ